MVIQYLNAEDDKSLHGHSLEIYQLLLWTKAPLGAREIQRRLCLSSPSVAQYHLNKLKQRHIVKKVIGGYVLEEIA